MTSLLLETATEVCSVAVARDGELLALHDEAEVHQHASKLTVFIRRVTERAGVRLEDLDRVVLSDGPGSFTSLRVGAATAKGLCVALPGLALWTVPTLDALAGTVGEKGTTLATLNSRRGEVYGKLFLATLPPSAVGADAGAGVLSEALNVRLTEADWQDRLLALAPDGPITVCGPGRDRLFEVGTPGPRFRTGGSATCSARNLLAPATAPVQRDIATYEPFYLNPPFVTRTKKSPLL